MKWSMKKPDPETGGMLVALSPPEAAGPASALGFATSYATPYGAFDCRHRQLSICSSVCRCRAIRSASTDVARNAASLVSTIASVFLTLLLRLAGGRCRNDGRDQLGHFVQLIWFWQEWNEMLTIKCGYHGAHARG